MYIYYESNKTNNIYNTTNDISSLNYHSIILNKK